MKLVLDRLPTEVLFYEGGTIEFIFDKKNWGGEAIVMSQPGGGRVILKNFGHTHTDCGPGPRIWKESVRQ